MVKHEPELHTKCHGPVEGRTEPQLVPSSRDIRERASDQG